MRDRVPFWLVWVTYFGLLSVFLWQWQGQLIWWWLGGLAGVSLIWLDRLVYVYLTRPNDQLSVYVKFLVKDKRFREAVKALKRRGDEQKHLVSQSFLFMLIWIPAAVYVISSSGSLLASGLVLGVGLRCGWEMVVKWPQRSKFKQSFFWQIKREISDRELNFMAGMWLGVFWLLSAAMI